MKKAIVTTKDLEGYLGESGVITLTVGQKLTPAAIDIIKERKWLLEWCTEPENESTNEDYVCSNSECCRSGCNCIEETRVNPRYKVKKVALSDYKLEPFDCGVENQDIWLKDIFTRGDNPNLAAGMMSFRRGSQFPWHLDYDEIDLVLSGTLRIETPGNTIIAKAGEVVSIPRGTSLIFGTPDECLVYYVTYPANWSDA